VTDILVPNEAEIGELISGSDAREHPAPNPFAVYREKALTEKQCNVLCNAALSVEEIASDEKYECQAKVKPIVPMEGNQDLAKVLGKLDKMFLEMGEWWDYELDVVSFSFMTYQDGGDYPPHIDVAPGTSRKLSGVVQLSKSDDYTGGDLSIHTIKDYTIPRTIGTFVVFPAYMMHSVTPVTEGRRHSLVIAAWGPPFR
jgi:hypothetical protein